MYVCVESRDENRFIKVILDLSLDYVCVCVEHRARHKTKLVQESFKRMWDIRRLSLEHEAKHVVTMKHMIGIKMVFKSV